MTTIKDCDLLERVNWIKDATSGKDLGVGQLTSFYIHGGFIHASDGRMVVGTPFPMDGIGTVLVPCEPFLKVLANRPPGDFSWEMDQERLTLKRGRFRGKVKLLPPDLWQYPPLDTTGQELPERLVEGLQALLPFVSENATKPWATCILAKGDYLYASNNIVVARVNVGPAAFEAFGDEGLMIPRWVAEFIAHRVEGLEWWAFNAERGQLTFGWEDGSWARTSMIVDKFPPVETVLEKMYREPTVEITPEWRTALLRVGKITGDPVLRLREDGVYGAGGEAVLVEDEASTPVPEGLKETIWDIRYLEPVLDQALRWEPTTYPQPAPWKGSVAEGVIMGRRD